VDTDEDLLPFRQAEARPRNKRGVTGVFFLLHHNTINVRKPTTANEDPEGAHKVEDFVTWMDSDNQQTGHVVNAELSEKEQMRLRDKAPNPEESLEEKLKEKKQRLQEAKVNFQKSMDKLNNELVFLKTDV
jgi:hypothetical protein